MKPQKKISYRLEKGEITMIRKKISYVVLVIICLIGISVGISKWKSMKEDQPADFVERLEEALGDDLKKQTETVVGATISYGDEEGNGFDYHILKTTYYEADPSKVTGLHTSALEVLFQPANAKFCRQMMIQDWYGALYELEEKSYLCWTYSPEVTYVLEYNPEEISDEEILKMAEGAELFEE